MSALSAAATALLLPQPAALRATGHSQLRHRDGCRGPYATGPVEGGRVVYGGETAVGKGRGRLSGDSSAETEETASARDARSRTRALLKGVQ